MRDTPQKIEDRYREMLLSLKPSERLRMVSRMLDSGKKIVMAGLRNEDRLIDPRQLKWQLFLRMYKNDFTPPELEQIRNKIIRL